MVAVPPYSYDDFIQHGAECYQKGIYAESAKHFDRAVELNAAHVKTLRMAAEAHISAGSKDIAIIYLTTASKIAPENKNIAKRLNTLTAPAWRRTLTFSSPFPVTAT
ncbi:hypothetical protein D3C85_1412380 [compost metagenome]